MLEVSAGIGLATAELEDRHEARKAFGRVAEHGPTVLGVDHWAVRRARAHLGQDQNPSPVRLETPPQPQSVQPRLIQPQTIAAQAASPPSQRRPRRLRRSAGRVASVAAQAPSRTFVPHAPPPQRSRKSAGQVRHVSAGLYEPCSTLT
jgi:hypothetical protein